MDRPAGTTAAMLDWLRLMRISGLCTIASNLLAATLTAFYVGDGIDPVWLGARLLHELPRAWWVVAASALLFASGMVWNDLADLDRDRIIRPKRPLPAGRIAMPAAVVLGAVTAVGALVCAAMAGGEIGVFAGGTVLMLALLYDLAAKQVPWLGAAVMAATRSGHALFALLLLGPDYLRMALVAPTPPGLSSPLLYAAALGLYVFGLTLVSELEHRRGRRWELIAGALCMALAVVLALVDLVRAPWLPQMLGSGGWRPLAGLATLALAGWALYELGRTTGVALWRAINGGSRARIGPVIGAGLAGMILLDAVLAAGAHPLGVVVILPLYGLFIVTSRMIRMD